jgi:hypothetical protein
MPDCEKQEVYVLDEQDQQEFEALQRQLEPVQQQIVALEGQQDRLYPRDVSEYFHLGMVGRGGRASARLNARKIGAMDRSLEITKKLEPLYRERTRLTALIADITSGRRKLQREKLARLEQRRQEAQERVRQAGVDDYVIDSVFGVVKVGRRNQKSLTIETSSGYREARRFELIKDVVRNVAPSQDDSGVSKEG